MKGALRGPPTVSCQSVGSDEFALLLVARRANVPPTESWPLRDGKLVQEIAPPESDEAPMTPATQDRTATAYHEAGHAVASIALGLPIHSVSIVPDDVTAGRVRRYDNHPADLP